MTFISIQGLRFIAALLVLFFHLGISTSGYKGVDLFFVISGFVIYFSTRETRGNSGSTNRRKFLINRLSKIYLLYWTSMFVLYVSSPFPVDAAAIGSILLVPGHKSILGVSWSLSYELYLYFLFFIFCFLLNKKIAKQLFLIGFLFLSVLTIIQFTPWSLKGNWINFFVSQHLWEFLLGVLASKMFFRYAKESQILPFSVFVIAIVLLLGWSLEYNSPASSFVYGLLSFGLVVSVVLLERKFPFSSFAASLINSLGNASYALYLFSPVIISILRNYHLSNIIVIIAVITLSIFIHSFFEAPLLKYVRKKTSIFVIQ